MFWGGGKLKWGRGEKKNFGDYFFRDVRSWFVSDSSVMGCYNMGHYEDTPKTILLDMLYCMPWIGPECRPDDFSI